jgi:hypothetical protein
VLVPKCWLRVSFGPFWWNMHSKFQYFWEKVQKFKFVHSAFGYMCFISIVYEICQKFLFNVIKPYHLELWIEIQLFLNSLSYIWFHTHFTHASFLSHGSCFWFRCSEIWVWAVYFNLRKNKFMVYSYKTFLQQIKFRMFSKSQCFESGVQKYFLQWNYIPSNTK